MLLYQPTASEIAAALAKATTNYPHIAGNGRVDKAAELLANVHIWRFWSDKSYIWILPSASNPAHAWQIEGDICRCPDYAARTVLVDSQPVCKHSLALRAYRYILLARLTAHLAEDGLRVLYMGYGHADAYRDAAAFRVWRKFDPITGQPRGPYRFRADYDLCLYAEQLHAESQPDYQPPKYAWHNGIPIAVPPRPSAD